MARITPWPELPRPTLHRYHNAKLSPPDVASRQSMLFRSCNHRLLVNRLRDMDTRARAVGNVLEMYTSTKSVSNLILAVEVRCHKVQGMTEAFSDTLYSCENEPFSSPKSRIYRFSRAKQQINLPRIMLSKKLPSCSAPCDSAPPPPE